MSHDPDEFIEPQDAPEPDPDNISAGHYMQTGTHLTLADLPRLKKAYEEAVAKNENAFMFEVEAKEVAVLTDYAKYAIEYLETLKKQYEPQTK